MSIQPRTTQKATEFSGMQLLSFDSSSTDTHGPSDDASSLWATVLARSIETDYEKHVFATPGVIEALDEAIAEVGGAMKRQQP